MVQLPEVSEQDERRSDAPQNATRMTYVRYAGGTRQLVYYEVAQDGSETFWLEEFGDVRCFPFLPSPGEIGAARSLRKRGISPDNSDAYIDVDIPPGTLEEAGALTLKSFRAFVHRNHKQSLAVEIDRMVADCLRWANSLGNSPE
jgi:hypothetical protein